MNRFSITWDRLIYDPRFVIAANVLLCLIAVALIYRKHALLIFKSLRRNLRRTILTGLAIFVLVFVVTLVWTVLWFLDMVTAEKSKDFKAIVTERWQLPSQMPFSYAATLSEGAAAKPEDVRPEDHMTWQFFGGTIDPGKRTREGIVFFFCMDPAKLLTMMDGLDTLTGEQRDDLEEGIRKMQNNKRGVLIGRERLRLMNKEIGERMTVSGLNYKDINLEV
jgi:putative ABC transport system permease protein